MRILQRCVHGIGVFVGVALLGAVAYYVLSFIGLMGGGSLDRIVGLLLVALPFLQVALVVVGVWKQVTYKVVLPATVVGGAIVLYLTADDSERPPLMEVGATVMSPDAPGYLTYRWMLKDDPQNRLAEMPGDLKTTPWFSKKDGNRADFFTKHRAEIQQAWEQDKVGRAWIDAMARHKPEGLYPLAQNLNGPLPSFGHFRNLAKIYLGYANVLVLDDKDDDAARLLVLYFRAHYHLQQGGASLLTQMIAQVILKGAYELLELLVTREKLSPALRIELVAVLKEAPSPADISRRVFLGEHVNLRIMIDQVCKGFSPMQWSGAKDAESSAHEVGFLGRLIFNPHRCERECVELFNENNRSVVLRDMELGRKLLEKFNDDIDHLHLKNPLGRQVKVMAMPAFNSIAKNLWENEDRRLALLKKLEAP